MLAASNRRLHGTLVFRQTWTRAGNSLESSGVEWLAGSI